MYGYDDLYRLVSMTNIDGKNSNVQFERYFGYSPNGNLISQNLVDKGHFKSYSYGGPLYMGGFHGPHAVTEMVDVWNNAYHFSFYYDENGNIKKKDNHLNGNSTEFQFDHENQLRNVTLRDGQGSPQRISLFNYNYEGNRVHKYVEFVGSVGGPVSRIYIDELLEHDIINNQRIIYVFANGKRIARIVDATTLIYHKDVRGSSKVVTNSQGQLVEERHYYPFGDEYNAPPISSIPMTRRFNDKEYDSSTGLYYYGKRYYDKVTGRWISKDPYYSSNPSKAISNPQRFNLYSYTLNDPINYIDPDGQNEEVASYSAGLGDSLTFGGTIPLRWMVNKIMDKFLGGSTSSLVRYNSTFYSAGEYTGLGLQLLGPGVAAGVTRRAVMKGVENGSIKWTLGRSPGSAMGHFDSLTNKIVIDLTKANTSKKVQKTIYHEGSHFVQNKFLRSFKARMLDRNRIGSYALELHMEFAAEYVATGGLWKGLTHAFKHMFRNGLGLGLGVDMGTFFVAHGGRKVLVREMQKRESEQKK